MTRIAILVAGMALLGTPGCSQYANNKAEKHRDWVIVVDEGAFFAWEWTADLKPALSSDETLFRVPANAKWRSNAEFAKFCDENLGQRDVAILINISPTRAETEDLFVILTGRGITVGLEKNPPNDDQLSDRRWFASLLPPRPTR